MRPIASAQKMQISQCHKANRGKIVDASAEWQNAGRKTISYLDNLTGKSSDAPAGGVVV